MAAGESGADTGADTDVETATDATPAPASPVTAMQAAGEKVAATAQAVGAGAQAAGEKTAEAVQVAGQKTAEAVQVAQEKATAATLPDRAALVRGRGALAVGVAGVCGYALLYAAVRANRSTAVDIAVALRLQKFRRPWVARLMTAASWAGFLPQNAMIPAFTTAALWLLGFRVESGFYALAAASGPLSSSLKYTMKRPRPDAPDLRVAVAPLGGSSFPSGHVFQYVGGYGFLAYLAHTLLRKKRVRQPIVAALCGLIGLVGPSRIYQGHHWPTDVSASYMLGTSYLLGVITLYRRVKARGVRR